MFWATECPISPLFHKVAGQLEVPAGKSTLGAGFPAQKIMFCNLCCTLDFKSLNRCYFSCFHCLENDKNSFRFCYPLMFNHLQNGFRINGSCKYRHCTRRNVHVRWCRCERQKTNSAVHTCTIVDIHEFT